MAKKVKILRDLQLDDPFFVINSAPITDKFNTSIAKASPGSPLLYYDVQETIVTSLESDKKNKDILVINGEFRGPKLGYNGKYTVDSIFSDRDQVNEHVADLISVEHAKIEAMTDELGKMKEFLVKTLRIFDPELKALKNEIVFRTEESRGSDDESEVVEIITREDE